MRQYPFFHRRDKDRRFFAFDMFETLVENRLGTVEPIFETLCTYYPGVEPSLVSHTYHMQTKEFKATHQNMELPINEIISNLDRVFGFDNDPSEMEKPLLRDTHIYDVCEGTERTLRYLKDNGYRIGVLSNTRYHSPTLRGMLEDCGISEYVDVVVASADIGYRKPHTEAYRAVLAELGADAKDCFYCGDNLSNDYFGPLSAGMRGAVHIDRKKEGGATHAIRDIGDLPSLFKDIIV